jgi:hypothetical protein
MARWEEVRGWRSEAREWGYGFVADGRSTNGKRRSARSPGYRRNLQQLEARLKTENRV